MSYSILDGTGDVTITGTFQCSSTMQGTGHMLVASGGLLRLSAPLVRRTIENDGMVEVQSDFRFDSVNLINRGTMTLLSEGRFLAVGGAPAIMNQGNLVGNQTFDFSGVALHNSGTINVTGGSFKLSGSGSNTGQINVSA